MMRPYWDWTMPQYRPYHPDKGWIIPRAFKAFLRPEAVEKLLGELDPKPTPAQAKAFARWPSRACTSSRNTSSSAT